MVVDRSGRIVRVRWVRIGRNTCRQIVHVNAQNGGEDIFVDKLGVVQAAVLVPLVAQRDVEVAIGTEMQIAAIVIVGLVILIDENEFGIRIGLVWIPGHCLKSG